MCTRWPALPEGDSRSLAEASWLFRGGLLDPQLKLGANKMPAKGRQNMIVFIPYMLRRTD
jgi:hypothetical protein